MRLGVLQNPRSHANKRGLEAVPEDDGIASFVPTSPEELQAAMETFAAQRIEALVIDGGDGTVRDVFSRAFKAFDGRLPPIAIVPHGKTNALAGDLAVPVRWSMSEALAAVRDPAGRRKRRPVLQVLRPHEQEEDLSGFIFGTGAFVRATHLAQRVHKAGLFHNLGVGASLAAFAAGTVLGTGHSSVSEDIALAVPGQPVVARRRFMIFASTLERMPLGAKPFGPARPGLKLLDVDAPPRHVVRHLPALLRGREHADLAGAGYRRLHSPHVRLSGVREFVLDGEIHQTKSDIELREGPIVTFVSP